MSDLVAEGWKPVGCLLCLIGLAWLVGVVSGPRQPIHRPQRDFKFGEYFQKLASEGHYVPACYLEYEQARNFSAARLKILKRDSKEEVARKRAHNREIEEGLRPYRQAVEEHWRQREIALKHMTEATAGVADK